MGIFLAPDGLIYNSIHMHSVYISSMLLSFHFIPFCQIQITILHPVCNLNFSSFSFQLWMSHNPDVQVTTNTHLPVTFTHEPWSHKRKDKQQSTTSATGVFLDSQNWPNVMLCMFHTSMHLLIFTESHVMGPLTAQNNIVIRYLPCHKTHYIDADRPNLVTTWVRPVSQHQRLVLAQRNCGTQVYNLAK